LVAALAAALCVSLDPARLDPARLDPCAALLPDAALLDDDVWLDDDSVAGAAVERTALVAVALDKAEPGLNTTACPDSPKVIGMIEEMLLICMVPPASRSIWPQLLYRSLPAEPEPEQATPGVFHRVYRIFNLRET
jgi:hypothetical protein